jgi:MFS family permease
VSETLRADRQEILTGAKVVSPRRVFWATWFGWMLDGFDSAIYTYVLVAALTDLLPASGIAATRANIGFYGGLLFSIYMLGWASSMVWGWAADHLGRVRVMCWTVLVYSTVTGLCGLSTGLVMFAVFRFLAGFGIAVNGQLVRRCCTNRCRKKCVSGLLAGSIRPPRPGCFWQRLPP